MKNNSNTIADKFELKSGEVVEMNSDELARWCCLIEAIEVVDKKGSQIGMDMQKSAWIKPIAFQKYIDERMDTMVEEIDRDKESRTISIY